ncbi:MAG TPA: hypothetical protein VL598_09675, partial [Trinickia sp.]|uniref:hypothetical protein n=1 Tax=Trinickia sp. TaxID=2571163 RepID=UPI002B5D6D82
MTSSFSKRLLINLAVVAAAIGANALVAYTQIRVERATSARSLQSMNMMGDLDAYRGALTDGLEALGRFGLNGVPVPSMLAAGQAVTLA